MSFKSFKKIGSATRHLSSSVVPLNNYNYDVSEWRLFRQNNILDSGEGKDEKSQSKDASEDEHRKMLFHHPPSHLSGCSSYTLLDVLRALHCSGCTHLSIADLTKVTKENAPFKSLHAEVELKRVDALLKENCIATDLALNAGVEFAQTSHADRPDNWVGEASPTFISKRVWAIFLPFVSLFVTSHFLPHYTSSEKEISKVTTGILARSATFISLSMFTCVTIAFVESNPAVPLGDSILGLTFFFLLAVAMACREDAYWSRDGIIHQNRVSFFSSMSRILSESCHDHAPARSTAKVNQATLLHRVMQVCGAMQSFDSLFQSTPQAINYRKVMSKRSAPPKSLSRATRRASMNHAEKVKALQNKYDIYRLGAHNALCLVYAIVRAAAVPILIRTYLEENKSWSDFVVSDYISLACYVLASFTCFAFLTQVMALQAMLDTKISNRVTSLFHALTTIDPSNGAWSANAYVDYKVVNENRDLFLSIDSTIKVDVFIYSFTALSNVFMQRAQMHARGLENLLPLPFVAVVVLFLGPYLDLDIRVSWAVLLFLDGSFVLIISIMSLINISRLHTRLGQAYINSLSSQISWNRRLLLCSTEKRTPEQVQDLKDAIEAMEIEAKISIVGRVSLFGIPVTSATLTKLGASTAFAFASIAIRHALQNNR